MASLNVLVTRWWKACNGAEVLQLASDATQSFDLLVTDMIMPKIEGQDYRRKSWEFGPAIRTVQMSGFHDTLKPPSDDDCPKLRYLQKPFTLASLAAFVRRALDQEPS